MMQKKRRELLNQYIKSKYESSHQIQLWISTYEDDQSIFFEIYEFLKNIDKLEYKDNQKNIGYKKENSNIYICISDKDTIEIDAIYLIDILIKTYDILMPILPYGTIVDLDKEIFRGQIDIDNIKNFRMAIDYRYAYLENAEWFFPYGLVVYPLGHNVISELLYITPSMIKEVVFEGYSDELENQFEIEMKKELIIQKNKASIGFANPEERKIFENMIKKKKEHNV